MDVYKKDAIMSCLYLLYRTMKTETTAAILILACLRTVSGKAIDLHRYDSVHLKDNVCPPAFTVMGRHHTPRMEQCIMDHQQAITLHDHFIQKYITLLGLRSGNDQIKEKFSLVLSDLVDGSAENFNSVDSKCTACSAAVKLIRLMLDEEHTTESIKALVQNLCIDLNILYPEMCKSFVRLYGNALSEIVRSSPHNELTFCALLFNGMCYHNATDSIRWTIEVPSETKPPVARPEEKPGKPKLKVLHISDTHWDVQYTVGESAECRGFLCCRKNSLPIPSNNEKGGEWGGWMCDLPEKTFDSFVNHVSKQHPDIDYILWTGDIPAHDLWEQNVGTNTKILELTVAKLKDAFPGIPIYPALGNHEAVPPNLFPTNQHHPDNILSWLYSKLDEEWKDWLPNNSSETILKGGFYSVLIRPKLRLISMNMNFCYTMNWWLILNDVDPLAELEWLVDELLKAEKNGEKVHIIGHIPPGHNDCLKGWQTNFYKIINRFENTVVAQFYGHTHYDEVEIFYDMKDVKRPFAVAYLAPSLTTYTYLNPGYKVYEIDGDYEESTRYVLDHETWIMDLEKSNKENKAYWSKYYTAKNAYSMRSLFPQDWHEMYEILSKDCKAFDTYYRHYWKGSPKRPVCNKECRMEILCNIRSCAQYEKIQPGNDSDCDFE